MTIGELIQISVVLSSTGVAIFCITLSRRLKKLNNLEIGLGGAIAVMAAEVDRLEKAICAARDEAMAAGEALSAEVDRAGRERALWELRQRIGYAAGETVPLEGLRRLRKRRERVSA